MELKIFIVKMLTKMVNLSSYLYISAPAFMIDRTMKLIWAHPWMIKPVITTIRPSEIEKMAQKLVVYRFKKNALLVPALIDLYKKNNVPVINSYKKFKKYVPETDKNNYIKKYPTEYRCVNGRLPSKGTLYKSAGTSGKSTIWAQSYAEESFFGQYVRFGLDNSYGTSLKNYKIINCWAFGTWPTAIDFTQASTQIGQMINVGPKIDETLEMLKFLGKNYCYIIVGYPPFLDHLFSEGLKHGFNWKDWYINVLSGGEGFIEEWREKVKDHLGSDSLIYSAYGSTDLGLSEGMETFLTVILRRIAHVYQTFLDSEESARELSRKYFPDEIVNGIIPKNEETVRKFFIKLFKADPSVDRRLPMIFQYDPTVYFNEEVVKQYGENRQVIEMLTTVVRDKTAMPRIRYNVKDERGIIKYDDMMKFLKDFGIDIQKIVHLTGFETKNILHLPFFYIYGRSDGTVSIDGANIFPADIEELIADDDEFDNLIASFIMKVTEDGRLGFDLELKKDLQIPENTSEIRKKFSSLLEKYSSSFMDIVKEGLKSSNIVLTFHNFASGPFEEGPLASKRLIKNRYIRR